MPHRRTARLARWQMHLLCWSGAGLLVTGVVWLLLHYFGQREGEFGPEMNPLEPWAIMLHGICVVPALLGIGGLFIAHIPKGWQHRSQRLPGIALSALIGMLIASGYLLYYTGDEVLRETGSLVHWMIGLALPAIALWHYLGALRVRRRR